MNVARLFRRRPAEPWAAPAGYAPDPSPPPSGMDAEAVRRLIDGVPFWWHSIELGHGLVTPGHQGGGRPWVTRRLCEALQLPADMTGRRVLDIGAWDGYFSFACERRGASSVLAVDSHYRLEREGKELDAGSRGFQVAREVLASRAEYQVRDVMDLSPEQDGMFDVVLFLGVLYHLRHPLLALERLAAITTEMMVLETQVEDGLGDRPLAMFYENTEANADPTNWWGPNPACVAAMTRSAGFREVRRIGQIGARLILHAYK